MSFNYFSRTQLIVLLFLLGSFGYFVGFQNSASTALSAEVSSALYTGAAAEAITSFTLIDTDTGQPVADYNPIPEDRAR